VLEDGLLFAERLLSLLDATRYSATYKLATLLALIDVVAEHTGPTGTAPTEVSAKAVGRRVIELYWPQTVPYGAAPGGEPRVLAQARLNDIPTKLARWREAYALRPGASLDDARRANPSGWSELEEDLVATVIGMPLAKLQRFGVGRTTVEDRFIFDFGWRDEVKAPTVWSDGFDDRLHFKAGVGNFLVRLAPLIRPLVHAKWLAMVAARNPDLVESEQLGEFLFGAQRITLDRVRGPLVDAQGNTCFYCGMGLARRIDVDHFLPWSRHPDNTLDNLVATHSTCNNAKSASLAGVEHLGHWLDRFGSGPGSDGLRDVEESTRWPRRPDRVLSSARAIYLWLPEGTMLWQERSVYDEADVGLIRRLFAATG
jgi:hypothetical protein